MPIIVRRSSIIADPSIRHSITLMTRSGSSTISSDECLRLEELIHFGGMLFLYLLLPQKLFRAVRANLQPTVLGNSFN